MFDGGRTRPKQARTAIGDSAHFPKPVRGVTDATLPVETFAQRYGDCPCHCLACEPRKLAGELVGFLILDVQSHGFPT